MLARLGHVLFNLFYGTIGVVLVGGLPVGLVVALWLHAHGQPCQAWRTLAAVSSAAWVWLLAACLHSRSTVLDHGVVCLALGVPFLLVGMPAHYALPWWGVLALLFLLGQAVFGAAHILETLVTIVIVAAMAVLVWPTFAEAKAKAEAFYLRTQRMHADDRADSPR